MINLQPNSSILNLIDLVDKKNFDILQLEFVTITFFFNLITHLRYIIWILFSQTRPSDIAKIWRNGTSIPGKKFFQILAMSFGWVLLNRVHIGIGIGIQMTSSVHRMAPRTTS
mgnify:CR=1 FL=1